MYWENFGENDRRLPVPGGWIYQVRSGSTSSWSVPVFVPDPWAQQATLTSALAELRATIGKT